MLTLTVLSVLPTLYVARVEAVNQSGPLTWSPFGPRSSSLLISVYGDFQPMFSAFLAGRVDITDWAVSPADLHSFGSNPDFFLTGPIGSNSVFNLARNAHKPFLGKPQQTARTLTAPSALVTGTNPGCSTGFGRLVITLRNLEETGSPILDSLNVLTATGPVPVSSIKDDSTGLDGLDGVYVLPTPSACVLVGSYTISTSVYAGSAIVTVDSGVVRTVDFHVNYNSASIVKPTPSSVEIGRALAHLIDKSSYLIVPSVGGRAEYNDIQAGAGKGLDYGAGSGRLTQPVIDEDCAAHPWKTPCSPTSAYNLAPDNIGGASRWYGNDAAAQQATAGFSGVEDLHASCDHFIAAGFSVINAIDPNKDDCLELAEASLANPGGSYPHLDAGGQQLVLYGRSASPRRAYSAIYADTLNFVFGTPNAGGTVLYGTSTSPRYFTISQVFPIVFEGPPDLDDWDLYTDACCTGGDPSHLVVYTSDYSGGVCAGSSENLWNGFHCNPSFDSDTTAGLFASTLAESVEFFKRAALTGHRTVMTVPILSFISQFVALNGWNFEDTGHSSLVSPVFAGVGWLQGFWSLLNMRQKPGYVPVDSRYVPGGGDPTLIRRGFSQEVHKLSLFHATTNWDFEVLLQIYDSMLALNPSTGLGGQLMDWMTSSHSQTFNPNEVSTLPDGSSFTGTTTQTWRLRNDVKWHDGTQVPADDVCFSLLTIQNVPSGNLGPSASTIASCRVLNSQTVQVKHILQSPYYEQNTGGLPIIPVSKWASLCSWPGSLHDSTTMPSVATLQASMCGDPGFDPMQAGIMMGSGPWVCKHTQTGAVGGSCTQNADDSVGTQDVVAGGRINLTANNDYMRGRPGLTGSNLHRFSFADKNNDGLVSIVDIADAALHFGEPDPYWDSSYFGVTPGIVDIGEVATIAFYYDHGLTRPFQLSQLAGLDPCVDPFFQASPSC